MHAPRPQAPPLIKADSPGSAPLRAEGWVSCGVCHTRNQLGHRYCVACGSGLQGDVSMHVVSGPIAQAAPLAEAPVPSPLAAAAPQPTAPRDVPPLQQPGGSRETSPENAPGTAPTAAFAAFPAPGSAPAPAPAPGFATSAIPQPLSPPLQPLPAAPIGAPLPPPTPQLDRSEGAAPRPSFDPLGTGSPSSAVLFRPPTVPDGLAAAAVARRESDPSFAQNAALAAPYPAAPAAPETAPAVVCLRCQSSSDGNAQYCRVCGFALGGRSLERPPVLLSQTLPLAERHGAPGSEPLAPPTAETSLLPSTGTLERASHAAPASAPRPAGRLVLLGKDGSDGAAYPLLGDTVDVGAREGAVQIPDDPYLSPRHARLARENGGWQVIDLESVNGVYIKLRGQRPVADGDLILLGQQVLRFEIVSDAEHGLRPAAQHGAALFGTPQAARYARLCQRTVEGVTRDIFHLHRAETSLGRETADIVFSDDPFLSRRHAVIRLHPSPAVPGGHAAPVMSPGTHVFTIEDHGSSNGTFVAIRGREPLTNGDVLRMGLHVFRVELQDAERGGQS